MKRMNGQFKSNRKGVETAQRMRRKNFKSWALVFVAALWLSGCTSGVIRGVVKDTSGMALEDVMIQTDPPTQSLLSTASGFIIRNVDTGDYTLMAVKDGYKRNSVYVQVHAGKVTYANIVLKPVDH